MLRSMASNVSALSSFVAKGHQTSISFPLPPLKFRTVGFPQYGFKRAVSRALRLLAVALTRPQWRSLPSAFYSVVGLSPKRHARPLTPHTRPVALGSASGYSVHQPHCLLWPHPSFCPPPPVSGVCRRPCDETEVPQFTLPELDSVPPSLLRWLQDADRRVCAPDLAFAHPVGARQPQFPHIRTACGLVNEAATFA